MMNKIEQLESQIEAMRKALVEIKAAQESKDDDWPQLGDKYWYSNVIKVCDTTYWGSIADNNRKSAGTMHRTKKEAEVYRAYRMNPRTVMRDRIQMWVDEYNNGAIFTYGINSAPKWSIQCNGNLSAFQSSVRPFAMKDRKGAELLLEKFGIDNILWACGGAEPSEGK